MLIVVGQSIRDARWVETPGLIFTMLLSAVAGTTLAKIRLPWFLLMPLGLTIGTGVVLINASSVADGSSVSNRLRETLARLDVWYEAANSGGISTDLLPFTVMLLSGAWLLGFFSAWFVFRRNNVWISVVSAGVMLLTNLSFLPDKFGQDFFIFIFVAMLLIVRVSVIQRHEFWRSLSIRYTPSIGWRTIHASLWFSILVLFIAALIPVHVITVTKAQTLWNLGRTPVARSEEIFTRLFSALPSRKYMPGRFFGNTLPFKGKISFGGEVVASTDSEYQSYWLSKTYSEYTSPGWIAPDTESLKVGPEILPPPQTDIKKRLPVDQTVQPFSTENFLAGSPNVPWVSRIATIQSLLPKKFVIDLQNPDTDEVLPDDIQYLANQLRLGQADVEPTLGYTFVASYLPSDLVLLEIELEAGVGLTTVIVQRKAPISPDIVAWDFDVEFLEDDTYRMTSIVSMATDDDLREAGTNYNRFMTDHYLQLPISLPQRVRNLSLDLTGGKDNPIDKTLAIQEYLRGPSFTYSRDIDAPPRNADGVEHFLFESREGYSDYFASSMAVLLRAAGVPTRLAVGYAPGELDENSGRRFLRDSDSHSWVQVYFPSYGWIDFEPTPNWDVPSRNLGGTNVVGLAPSGGDLDSDEFDPLADLDELFEDEFLETDWQSDINAMFTRDFKQYLIPTAIVLTVLALIGLGTRFLLNFGLGGLNPEARLYAKMRRLGLIARVRHRSNQTPREYAAILGLEVPSAAEAASSIATSYAASRYGNRQADQEEIADLQLAWRQIRLSLVGKTIGLVTAQSSRQPLQQTSNG